MLFIQAKIAKAFSTGEQRKSETTTNPAETEANELNVSPSKVKIKEEILVDGVKDEIKMERKVTKFMANVRFFLMALYMIFKHGKRFRFAPSFNKLFSDLSYIWI